MKIFKPHVHVPLILVFISCFITRDATNSFSEDEFSVVQGFIGYCTRRHKMGLLQCVDKTFEMNNAFIHTWITCLANMGMEFTNMEEAANAVCVPNPRLDPRMFTRCITDRTEATNWSWSKFGMVMKECLSTDEYSEAKW
ncbi:uncharacterized protein LOC143258115 [Tachypleus tridentatus]|uniref:uncharacterized protein LOC143258115 n=1 Tax=Tachypleus tridentatus TaxID=6853 RepID=UPI003FD06673